MGFVMHRRAILMFILFLVVALFYNSVIQQNMPDIQAKQKAQTEMLNNLDGRVYSGTP